MQDVRYFGRGNLRFRAKRRRDGEAHPRSDPDHALGPDAAAVRFDDRLANREAETRSAAIFLGRLPKPIIKMRQLLGRDARPAVLHPDQDLSVAHAGADGDGAAAAGEFHRVADEVFQHLEQALFVGLDRGELGRQIGREDDRRARGEALL